MEHILSVIIVNYKSWRHLSKCLDAIVGLNFTNFSLEIIVVDNDQDSDERQTFVQNYPSVKVIGNTGNNGFANACNFGAAHASGDYYLFLNPDTIANAEAIETIFNTAVANPTYGIVSCTQVNKNGGKEKEIRFFPQLFSLFGALRAFHRLKNRQLLTEKFASDKTIVFPDWVSGSVVLISKVWFDKVNGWDEDYWMYFEDVDLCKKVYLAQGKVALLRNVSILHNHGGATRATQKINAFSRFQVLNSKHIYIHKHFKGQERLWLQILVVFTNLAFRFLGALLGLILFFIPKLYIRTYLFFNLLRYYFRSVKTRTWLSYRSVNHYLNVNKGIVIEKGIRIGYEAKRIFHNRTGLGNYSRDLVSLLSKYYPKNNYYLYNPKEKKVDRLARKENIVEVLPKSKFWKKYSAIWRQGPVVKQLKDDKIQIFHGLSGELPAGLSKTGIKTVVTIHDLIFMRFPELYAFMDRKIHFKKFFYASLEADRVIAISEQTKKDIVEFLKVDPLKIDVVYQGCHALFKEQASEELINIVKNKFALPDTFILNVGTIETRKNLLTLVKAIKNVDITLVVVGGKTKYFKKVEAYIEENNMTSKVLFLSKVKLEELVAVYQMAKIFVYPSLFEGFGIPIIEALYSKIPVITSKGGVFPEAAGPYSAYVDPLDENELATTITQILTNVELRNEMITKSFEFVQKFNDENIAKNVMEVYKKL